MSANPYESPSDTTREDHADLTLARIVSEDDDDDPIALKINIPAFALSATTWMRLVFEGPVLLFSAVMSTAEVYNWIWFDGEPLLPLGLLGASTMACGVDLLILQGAGAMHARRRIDRVRRAAILSLLPTSPLFFLQIPFGIWVLRVLNDRAVQSRFNR